MVKDRLDSFITLEIQIVIMSQYADDIEEFAQKLTESEEYEERFEELVEKGFDEELPPEEHVNLVVDELTDQFVRDDPSVQNEVPEAGELLETTFEKITVEKFVEALTERKEFFDHLLDISEELSEE